MIKPDQRTRLQRIQRLRLAAATLDILIAERSDLTRLHLLHTNVPHQLRALADAYEASPVAHFALCKECREGTCTVHVTAPLRAKHERIKTPPRVAMSKRRPTITRMNRRERARADDPALKEYDEELEHELGQAHQHDIPDGSD